MKALLRRFVAGEGGQDLIEYAMLASLVSLVSFVALTTLGTKLKDFFYFVRLVFPDARG